MQTMHPAFTAPFAPAKLDAMPGDHDKKAAQFRVTIDLDLRPVLERIAHAGKGGVSRKVNEIVRAALISDGLLPKHGRPAEPASEG